MRRTIRWLLPALPMLFFGCGITESTASIYGLTLGLDHVPATIPLGHADTISATLTNDGIQPRTITFGSSCRILIHLRASDGSLADGYGCLAVMTSVTIPAGGSIHTVLRYFGGPALANVPGIPLAAGEYSVWAELDYNSAHLALRTPAVVVAVR